LSLGAAVGHRVSGGCRVGSDGAVCRLLQEVRWCMVAGSETVLCAGRMPGVAVSEATGGGMVTDCRFEDGALCRIAVGCCGAGSMPAQQDALRVVCLIVRGWRGALLLHHRMVSGRLSHDFRRFCAASRT